MRVAAGMVGAGIVPAPAELMQLRERLLRSKEELVWDEIKTLCQKADKTNLWAIKDAQYRLEVCAARQPSLPCVLLGYGLVSVIVLLTRCPATLLAAGQVPAVPLEVETQAQV